MQIPVFLLVLLVSLSACTNQSQKTTKNVESEDPVEYQIMVQRATQSAIWAMPAVALIDFIKATRRDLGGDLNDVVYLTKPLNSKHGFLTANDVTAYGWGSISMAEGPVIIEVPAATDKVSYFGSILNAWQQPLEDIGPAGADKGKGGKYLIIPPGYDEEISNKDKYIVIYSDTYQLGFSFRPRLYNNATDADAGEYAQRINVYLLKEENNPPKTNYLDATHKPYGGLPVYDETFFQDINDVIQYNPIRPQDKAMVGLLKCLGIEKGKEFNPSEEQKKAMNEGLELAYDYMTYLFTTPGQAINELWPGKNNWYFWNFTEGQPQLGFPFETENELIIDGRAGPYFYVTYLPKYLGGGTFYLTGLRDSNGDMYTGTDTYKLNVPADTPAKDFWSVIVYSMKTKGFVYGADRVGLSSRNTETMKMNEDGSYDIYFGPNPPEGYESNCIPTDEDFFLLFRLYGPETKEFYKTWVLSDLVKI